MLAIVHFTLGMLAVLVAVVPHIDRKYIPFVMVMGGVFAMVPDLGHFIEELYPLHESVWSNVFVLHGVVDALETNHPYIEAATGVGTLLIATVLESTKDLSR